EAQLAGDRKYFTISDRVTITVGGSTGGGNTPPTGTLTTASNNVTMPFVVDAIFSENVTDFILSDLTITNGTASNFTGSGSNYSFTITPIADGEVTVVIPIFKVLDNQGMGNNSPSNTLVVNYTSANTGGGNCDTPTNLALNKTATQHSTQFNADASRAVDGNNDGDFWGGNSISLTNWVDNPWWEVDLGTVAQIQTIKIWNRTDCCQSILSDYHVLVSDVPFTSTSLDAAINQNGVGDFLEMGSAGTPTTININRNGRYVRIQLAGQGFLGLAEVEVLGCTGGNTGGGGTGSSCTSPSNIASVGTAIQSSVQFEGTANKAIDGNTIGAFWDLSRPVSLTNWEDNAWWEIDLGAVADINELKIWNRNDCCENILKNYYVLVSDVPFTSSNLNTSINQSGVFSELQTTEAARPSTIAINRTGRYLRIQLQGQGFLALSEVEIMGCISNGINNNPPVFLTQADALPFQAIKEKEEVHLIWSTNTEWANDKFFIEKSIDGVHFEKIAKVNSQSDDAGLYFYQEIDAHPFLGKNYYRLHRIIKDGSEDYSAVFEVEFDSDKKELSIFPNPTNEKISVNISTFLGKDIQIQIFDARGFLVLEKNIKESSKHILPFDLKKYPSGLYFLSLKVNKQKRITQSFMITKY
ncbi:MAG TPA: T9SS type A sorting domain-containing protein, partial [Phaeodactylibacter sp.]|nr:T9SS type A sorting domain-containing protein [Phaeodactylibacter sp.]